MADIAALSIFTGSGMHDTGVELGLEALGHRLCPMGYVERESSAAATLLARMEHATLPRAPVWCDCLSRLDALPLRGFIDLIIASPPCQPYSSAGKRLGVADERSHGDGDGPLVHLARIFDESRPAVGWFENVPEWLADGHFREFGEELCRLGYDIAPPLFASSGGLGGVHERERVFVMVYARRILDERFGVAGLVRGSEGAESGQARQQRHGHAAGPAGSDLGDAHDAHDAARRRGSAGEQGDTRGRRGRPANASVTVGNPDGGWKSVDGGQTERGKAIGGRMSGPEGASGSLAKHAGGGLGAVRESSGRGGQLDRSDLGVAHAPSDGRSEHERGQGATDEPESEDALWLLGEPSSQRREGGERDRAPDARAAAHGPARKPSGPPLCPPGRPIFDDELAEIAGRDSTTLESLRGRIAGSAEALRLWAELAARGLDPTLMPAVEPGVSVVADALAPSTSDLLRIGGNGVDPLAVAYAFCRLWSRVFRGED